MTTSSGDDIGQASIEEIRARFNEYLQAFPDFRAWIESGALRPVGGGWFAIEGTLPRELGKYMNIRVRHGKPQVKPINLPKQLQDLRARLAKE